MNSLSTGALRDLRRNRFGHPIELPSDRVGNHLNRFGEADVADASVIHLDLELARREAGADLLLKRQPPDARVLHPQHLDAIDALAYRRQRDRQRIHREAGIDAGAENRHLRLARRLVELPSRAAGCAEPGTPPPRWW